MLSKNVFIFDSNYLFATGVATTLKSATNEDLHVELSKKLDFEFLTNHSHFDLAILDIDPHLFAGPSGRKICELPKRSKTHFVGMSFGYLPLIEGRLRSHGFKGYLDKSSEADRFVQSLLKALGGGNCFISPAGKGESISWQGAEISQRELQIMSMLRKGRDSHEIAAELCISFNTVKHHRKKLFQKLNIHKVQELVEIAISLNL
jgi:DNA-binding NarL/FixJ family response regulator